jgi:predicted O-methyltransferase YrrM
MDGKKDGQGADRPERRRPLRGRDQEDRDPDSVVLALLELSGGDPFADVLAASEAHRPSHGRECGLFPAGPAVMSVAAQICRAAGALRIADLGSGLGYSALWLAAAGGPSCRVLAVDRFEEHVHAARQLARQHRLDGRISFVAGEVAERLARENDPFDLIHDDAWFAAEPPHLERMIALLRPGGVITMPNWFLLVDALRGHARRDWSEFAGPSWAELVQRYAARLAAHPLLRVTWVVSPPLAIAVKRRDS